MGYWNAIKEALPFLNERERADLLTSLCMMHTGGECKPYTAYSRLIIPFVREMESSEAHRRGNPNFKKGETNIYLARKRTDTPSPLDASSPASPSLLFPQEVKKEIKESSKVLLPEKETKKDSELCEKVKKDWNSICVSLPKIRVINSSRISHLKKRLEEMAPYGDGDGYIVMVQCFNLLQQSHYCTGRVNGWKADFSWFIDSPNNWIKVFEGKYQNHNYEKAHKDKSFTEVQMGDKRLLEMYYEALSRSGLDESQFSYTEFLHKYEESKIVGVESMQDEIIRQQEIEEQNNMLLEGYEEQ